MVEGEGLSGPRGGLGGEAKSEIACYECGQVDLGFRGTNCFWVWVRASWGREEG